MTPTHSKVYHPHPNQVEEVLDFLETDFKIHGFRKIRTPIKLLLQFGSIKK